MGAIKITKALDYKGIITFFLATGNLGMQYGVYQSGRPVWPQVYYPHGSVQFSSVQSLSRVRLFATP